MAITSAASTRTALADAYKELFPDRVLEQLAMMDRDLLRWLPKADDLDGDGIWVPMRYARPQGISVDFAGGQASVTAGAVERAFISRNRYYGFVSIDDEAIYSARSNRGAFYNIKEVEIEDMIQQVAEELEKHLWRDGQGYLGVISSITNANPSVITLTNPEDVANFHPNMYLEARADAGSQVFTGADRGGDEQIASIDYDAGTLTMSSNVNSDHGWVATDGLFRGAAGAVASDYDGVVTGIAAWIPETAETSGTFLQMDRTADTVRLQGFRNSWKGTIEETVKDLRSRMSRLGATPDSCWVSHANWHRLELELGSRVIREDGGPENFGMTSLKYSAPKGVINIMAGAFCPEDVGYLLKRKTWMLHHLKGLPHIVVTDGLRSLRGADFDGITVRGRYWCELACDGPKHNGRFEIS